VAVALMAGCSDRPEPAEGVAAGRPAGSAAAPAAARPRVVVLGDSLTAGLGLPASQAYPALLQQKIERAGLEYEVVNAGVSGDTTAGGLRRLDWILTGDVRVLVVALGANDGLRGLPVAEMRRNLTAIVSTARNRGVAVLLAGMEAPPNVGPEYTGEFRAVYRDVADRQGVPLVPFLLDGVAGESRLNQPDGIHPNAEGAERLADTVWRALEPMLTSSPTR
jgi:acyl-CoA thioesterase I